jgi:hypothetical protein
VLRLRNLGPGSGRLCLCCTIFSPSPPGPHKDGGHPGNSREDHASARVPRPARVGKLARSPGLSRAFICHKRSRRGWVLGPGLLQVRGGVPGGAVQVRGGEGVWGFTATAAKRSEACAGGEPASCKLCMMAYLVSALNPHVTMTPCLACLQRPGRAAAAAPAAFQRHCGRCSSRPFLLGCRGCPSCHPRAATPVSAGVCIEGAAGAG